MRTTIGTIGRISGKSLLLLAIYLLHFCSFQYLKANPKIDLKGVQSSSPFHTNGNKSPLEKKPYSSFIVNHVVINQKQHTESEASVQLHHSDKDLTVIPLVVANQNIPADSYLIRGTNKLFKFLRVFII